MPGNAFAGCFFIKNQIKWILAGYDACLIFFGFLEVFMKKGLLAISLAAMLALAIGLAACVTDAGRGRNLFASSGTFVGSGQGIFGDEILVWLTVNRQQILGIEVFHVETEGWGDVAIDAMRNLMMTNQVIGVDIVTGATGTSVGFRTAVTNAAEAAGGNMNALLARGTSPVRFTDETVDVVVVGSGVAGLTAAIAVAEAEPTWNVVLIEKMGILGGNTTRASVNFGAHGGWSMFHGRAGIPRPTTNTTGATTNSMADRVIRMMDVNPQHYQNFAFLGGARGIVAPVTPLQTLGTHLAVRLPSQQVPGGHFVRAMNNKAARVGVCVRLNHDGFNLVQPGGPGTRVTGIQVGVNPRGVNQPPPAWPATRQYDYTYTLTATRAVVMATGGFHQNIEMKREHLGEDIQALTPIGTWAAADRAAYRAHFIDALWTTGNEGNTGDGHIMGKRAGAALRGMHRYTVNYMGIQVAPGSQNTLSLASIRGRGAINVGMDGRRLPHSETAQRFHEEGAWPADNIVWTIVNQRNHVNEIGNIRDPFLSGLVISSPTLGGLAAQMGMTGAAITNFEATMNQIMADARIYAAHQRSIGWAVNVPGSTLRQLPGTSSLDANNPSCFNQPHFDVTRRAIGWHWGNEPSVGPYFAFRNIPGVHGTAGGISVDLAMRALTPDNQIIPGLFAAGTSAYFSSSNGSRDLSWQNVTACGVTGYIAAMAIVGRPLYVNWDGTPGVTATAAPMLP